MFTTIATCGYDLFVLTSTHMQRRLEFCRVHAKNSCNEWWIDIDEKWSNLVNLKRKERYHDDSPRNKVRLISKENTKKLMIFIRHIPIRPSNLCSVEGFAVAKIIICATARPLT